MIDAPLPAAHSSGSADPLDGCQQREAWSRVQAPQEESGDSRERKRSADNKHGGGLALRQGADRSRSP
jgi:hypothetical protein